MRSFWRHEQMAIQMVLATVQHHSYGVLRNQKTATRTKAEERETYSAPRLEPPLPTDAGAQHFDVRRRQRAGGGAATQPG